jgi:very-short-patch-repair endonuclease
MGWDRETLKYRRLITTGLHLPYNPNLVEAARSMRKNPTEAEKMLWQEFLKGFRFRVLRQRPIDNFIVDFYCPRMKLVIEIDGAKHFTDEWKGADKERTKILEAYGLRVVRISNHDVINHFFQVCKRIDSICS